MEYHQVAGHNLPYDELSEIRDRLSEISPTLVQYGRLEPANFYSLVSKLSEVQFKTVVTKTRTGLD